MEPDYEAVIAHDVNVLLGVFIAGVALLFVVQIWILIAHNRKDKQ